MIFDETSQNVHPLDSKYRNYIEAAALLHDIGYYIDSKGHNKHSMKMILEHGLAEFNEKEIFEKEGANKIAIAHNKNDKIETLENLDNKYIEKTYKELLYNGDIEDLIKIIKTTYIRNDNRLKSNKKISDKDKTYFEKAEEYLYNELSISLDMSFDETKDYIINEVTKLINK